MSDQLSTQNTTSQSLRKINNLITFDDMSSKKEVTISVRLEEDVLREIERRARNYGVSRAAVIRRLVEDGLKAQSKLLPSASALEKEIASLNKKLDRIAEAVHEYAPLKHEGRSG